MTCDLTARPPHTGYEFDRKHVRHGATPHHPCEGLSFQQDRARDGLQAAAQKSWRCLDGHNQLPKLITGVKFADGIEVVTQPAAPQAKAA